VCYVAFQRALQLVVLLFRSSEFKGLEIIVLSATSRRCCAGRSGGRRSGLADRFFLTAASRLLPRLRWTSFLVTRTTLLD